MDWEKKVAAKREERERAIKAWRLSLPQDAKEAKLVKNVPITSGILTGTEISITESAPTIILKNIAEQTWTAEQVLRAFISRTVISHYLTNPLTEIFFQRGLDRAQELDYIQSTTGKLVGPLHGLPISLKDTLHIAGLESTMGYAAWIGNIQPEDDTLVKILREAGATFYCKTNVPQTLMSGECVNFVFGRTSTPWNTDLSAGGSSGGEGSLISLGGSPLGVGSDIAGSIRTPANFNGIYGLCPSQGRLPAHRASEGSGDSFIRGVYGPLARGVDGLELYMRTILGMRPWERDHEVLRIPWREEEYQEGLGNRHKLCFAFMPHDSIVTPNPPILRCMAELRQKIEQAGHQVIDLEPFNGAELGAPMVKILGATGGKEVHDVLAQSEEPLIKEVELASPESALSAWELKKAGVELGIVRQKYLETIVNTASGTQSGLPIDGIIMPSGGHVAPPHGTMEYYTYEAISNILDWTCATIPVGFVDPVLDAKPESFQAKSGYDQRNYDKCKFNG